MKEAVKPKKQSFQAWLDRRSAETADRYYLARRVAVNTVMEAKSQVWEDFGSHEQGFSAGQKMVLVNH